MAPQKKTTEHVITSTTFQREFRSIAQKIHAGESHYVIKISGLPVMAVIPIEEYKELVKERDERDKETDNRDENLRQFGDAARRMGEQIAKLGLSDEELEAQIEAGRKKYHRAKKSHEQAPE
ncbi:MAG TPA: hypothetical protein VKQ72_15635 [Aggregatilineales bacterium]|nr:hypothetical protein [Aggregatilineales bacterium]